MLLLWAFCFPRVFLVSVCWLVWVDVDLWSSFLPIPGTGFPWVLRRLKQGLHPAKIMRCGDQPEEPVDFVEASQFDLPRRPVEFGPAEDLLHQLALALG